MQGKHTIFSQLLEYLPKKQFDVIVKKHQGDKWIKVVTSWDLLIVLLHGQLNGEISLRSTGLTHSIHPIHLKKLEAKSIPRSTLSDACRTRKTEVFFEACQFLLGKVQKGRTKKQKALEFIRLIDSTPIPLKGPGYDWAKNNYRERDTLNMEQNALDAPFDQHMKKFNQHKKTLLDLNKVIEHHHMNKFQEVSKELDEIMAESLKKLDNAKREFEFEKPPSISKEEFLKNENNYKQKLNNLLKIYGTLSNDAREDGIHIFNLENKRKNEKNVQKKAAIKAIIDELKKDKKNKENKLNEIEEVLGEDLLLRHVTRGLSPKTIQLPLGNEKGGPNTLDLGKMVDTMTSIARNSTYSKFSMDNCSGTVNKILQSGIRDPKMKEKFQVKGWMPKTTTPQQVFNEALKTQTKYTHKGNWERFVKVVEDLKTKILAALSSKKKKDFLSAFEKDKKRTSERRESAADYKISSEEKSREREPRK